jgi:hypothetical protein
LAAVLAFVIFPPDFVLFTTITLPIVAANFLVQEGTIKPIGHRRGKSISKSREHDQDLTSLV